MVPLPHPHPLTIYSQRNRLSPLKWLSSYLIFEIGLDSPTKMAYYEQSVSREVFQNAHLPGGYQNRSYFFFNFPSVLQSPKSYIPNASTSSPASPHAVSTSADKIFVLAATVPELSVAHERNPAQVLMSPASGPKGKLDNPITLLQRETNLKVDRNKLSWQCDHRQNHPP